MNRTRDARPLDVDAAGFLSTGASGRNLVVNARQLEAGQQYTLRLVARPSSFAFSLFRTRITTCYHDRAATGPVFRTRIATCTTIEQYY